MTPFYAPSLTDALTLDEVVSLLAAQPQVVGIVLVGSTGNDGLTDHSDYDLLLIMADMPVPLYIVFTTIDGRLSDIIFNDTQFIENILAGDEPQTDEPAMGNFLTWLQQGKVVYDGNGRIRAAQNKIAGGSWLVAPDDKAIFSVWKGIHFNYHQTKRMLAAEDEVYETAVELRLTYMMAEVWLGYFTVRRLPWQGEKKAVRYWQTHDPDYLAVFQKYLTAIGCQQRFAYYTELAQRTLAPIGGLLFRPATTVTLQGIHWTTADIQVALDFWHDLLSSYS